jgi:hypothetical protein
LLTASSANAEVTQARITLAIEIGAAVLALGFTLLLNRSLINRILQPLNALQRASQTTEEANQPAGGCPASGLGIPL